MTGVISGAQLGVYGNSLGQAAGSLVGRPGQSNAFYINTTTGNLVVQAQDEYLASLLSVFIH